MDKTTNKATSRWLLFPTPNPQARLRLFCFPYAGGGASIYRMWGKHLPASVEVCPVQLPGQGERLLEPPFKRLSAMVEAIAPALLPYMTKPFAFFGHSMGAMISFELARWLRRHSERAPEHLFISGQRAPQVPDTDPPQYDKPDDEFIAELRRLNGTPQEVLEHAELMQLVLPQLRADFEVVQTYDYAPEPPLASPISAFGGIEDCGGNRELLAPWREQTAAAFTLQMFSGDHFYLHTLEPLLLKSLAAKLHDTVRALGVEPTVNTQPDRGIQPNDSL